MDKKPWWTTDLSEELTIVVLAAIAYGAMVFMEAGAKEVVSAIGGGLVGYLSRGVKDG